LQKVAPDTIGACLQQARISANIGLDEVSGATGISSAILKALENDDREQLPAEVYTRAFYKKYTVYLGLDPEEILAAYEQQPLKHGRKGSRVNFSTVVTIKGKEENMLAGIANKVFLAVIIVLGGALLYWIYKNYLASFIPFDLF